ASFTSALPVAVSSADCCCAETETFSCVAPNVTCPLPCAECPVAASATPVTAAAPATAATVGQILMAPPLLGGRECPPAAGGCQPLRRAVVPVRHGNRDRAVLLLEVLQDREHRARRHRGAVQGRDVLEPTLAPHADVEPPRLVVRRVRRRRELAVPLLSREPALDVELLGRRGAEVPRGDVDDPVWDAEIADQLLLDREQPVVLLARVLPEGEREHLRLVELVHAEHAACVLAGRARLAPEVRREAHVTDRQRLRIEDLLHVHRREPDLRG